MKQAAIYILASGRNGTLYTGVISQLVQHVWKQTNNSVPEFTQKYHIHDLVYHNLVYLELCDDTSTAIVCGKQVKAGSRAKEVALIESVNPVWRDLHGELV